MNPIVWLDLANVTYLVSYSVRDILWLRILTIVGATMLIPYYAVQIVPLHAAIEWSLVFIAINIYWVVRLIIERRPVHLTPDEARLREITFPSLTPREALDLDGMGRWDDVAAGESLVERDRAQKEFSVILRGDADVIYKGNTIAQLGEGQFIGEIDQRADVISELDVLMQTAGRVMCWPRDRLNAFLAKRPDVALALQRSIGFRLQQMLRDTLSELKPSPPGGGASF
jgi:hypothetical protein